MSEQVNATLEVRETVGGMEEPVRTYRFGYTWSANVNDVARQVEQRITNLVPRNMNNRMWSES